MVSVRFLNYVNVLLKAMNWAITSLSEKSASTRLFNSEVKSCSSSAALLICCKPACVVIKQCSSLNLLRSNARKFLKLAHIFSVLSFLRQHFKVSVYIPEELTA